MQMRKIAAQDVKPGMEIEYEHGGWTFRVVVGRCEESHGEVWVFSVAGVGRCLENGQEVTVLKEAQPDEPTAFGARVVVDGRRFLRAPDHGADHQAWLEENEGTWRYWDELLRLGPVSVIPDQGWTVPADTPEVPDATDPRRWDRWEDVPDMVVVRSGLIADAFRRNGDRVERLFPVSGWRNNILTADDLNVLAPFTEVSDA